MSQTTEVIAQPRQRDRSELDAQLWLILGKLTDAEDDCEDGYCGQLTGLLFALGLTWDVALKTALELWNASRQTPSASASDPQCPVCGSFAVDEEHAPLGHYYHCPRCGKRWTDYGVDDEDNEYILAQLLEPLEGRAVVQPIDPPPTKECRRCAGCGEIANDRDGTPWKYWLELSAHCGLAIAMGLVSPLPCPRCGGSGKVPSADGALRPSTDNNALSPDASASSATEVG